jgi:hypothetical protein
MQDNEDKEISMDEVQSTTECKKKKSRKMPAIFLGKHHPVILLLLLNNIYITIKNNFIIQ